MSFIASAADVGLTMSHCGVKRMIQNPRYIGDSFYPAIITSETARKLEDERKRREKVLGRSSDRSGSIIKANEAVGNDPAVFFCCTMMKCSHSCGIIN